MREMAVNGRLSIPCPMVILLVITVTLISGCAISHGSKLVTLGNQSVLVMSERRISAQENERSVGVMLAIGSMETQCVQQGTRVMTRHDFEDRVRAILKENTSTSITIRYMDDGATTVITQDSPNQEQANTQRSKNATPVSTGSNAITIWDASRSGNSDRIARCIKDGVPVDLRDQDGHTPLMLSAKAGNLEAASLLCASGADVNALNTNQNTPLLYALASRPGNRYYLDVIKLLVDKGADVNFTDNDGGTPLTHKLSAYWNGMNNYRLEAATILIEKGAHVNASSKIGTTALHAALRTTHEDTLELAKYLVENGADVNASDSRGRTPLMYAAGMRWPKNTTFAETNTNLAVVKLLVKRGADVNTLDKTGWTALMHASTLPYVAEYLREHGAH